MRTRRPRGPERLETGAQNTFHRCGRSRNGGNESRLCRQERPVRRCRDDNQCRGPGAFRSGAAVRDLGRFRKDTRPVFADRAPVHLFAHQCRIRLHAQLHGLHRGQGLDSRDELLHRRRHKPLSYRPRPLRCGKPRVYRALRQADSPGNGTLPVRRGVFRP